ncbi:hypothetical protein P7D22_01580 [Lichenihabitans sp. Uapishka_5]|uniref:hypothetical protein n=1 Tax=Lichenihabitans sp. Uapishka_5 TaxID=3037302 RepID=UPI0029E8274C|nr:hypothetical protein [Lichenihabitans sp. Uapishka_5]MDX7949866.1 hypothetical protein [Lichenihabitans sp. Uapishka_5]
MRVSDILTSCAHHHVAAAAVASIGGDFAANVRRRANGAGVTIGDFTAERVRMFSGRASEGDWRVVAATMEGQDLALLSGLQVVMTRMMAEDGRAPAPEHT